ncbi:hypothetical protein A6R68_23945 [Neotoma lepida]|uniref:Uncharacterized protein n=1 Tax=Neotoma lepida TaxID=56216 RepID=A0A1A6HWF8_NEOLE|nr:hypothetical protein A6R68_23945 [Neotoma lepida]
MSGSSEHSEPLEQVVTCEETVSVSVPSSLDSHYIHVIYQYQALFSVGPVVEEHRGTFKCYGLSKKPSLLTYQGHILDPVKILIFQCCSDINYDRCALYNIGRADLLQHSGQPILSWAPSAALLEINTNAIAHTLSSLNGQPAVIPLTS